MVFITSQKYFKYFWLSLYLAQKQELSGQNHSGIIIHSYFIPIPGVDTRETFKSPPIPPFSKGGVKVPLCKAGI